MNRLLILCALLLPAGCASAPAPVSRTTLAQSHSRTEPAAPREEHEPPAVMMISGLHGSLSTVEAQGALAPRMEAFAACFHEHGGRIRGLGGEVRLHIHVAADGSVRAAYPEDSTVGHRDVERCLSDVAVETRFPRPRGGGEATLSWPIMMDPPQGVRHPSTWDPSRVAGVVERRAGEVLAQCRPEGHANIQVTAYVRDGRVISAGAATDDESGRESLDCIVARVRTWQMPPARRMAKVTFALAATRG